MDYNSMLINKLQKKVNLFNNSNFGLIFFVSIFSIIYTQLKTINILVVPLIFIILFESKIKFLIQSNLQNILFLVSYSALFYQSVII